MRFIVIGAGGIGAYFGGELARAGHEVTLFARGAHLAALRERGLLTRTAGGEYITRVGATDDPNALPPADVAILSVKNYSLPEVIPVVRLVAERGADVVSLLNGVTAADELIAGGVPRSRVIGGLARVSVFRTAPGVVERRSDFHSIVVGELNDGLSDRATRVADAFRGAGIDARASATMDVELWQKFVFITAMAAVCGLARTPIGPVREAPGGRRLIRRAVTEVVDVAHARGIALPDDEAPRTAAYIDTLPAAMVPSFLVDLEAGGPTELDSLSGTVSRFSAEAGLETPVHDTAVAALGVRR